MSANVRQNSETVSRPTPGRSSDSTAVGFLLSGTRRSVSSTPTMPTGMLTRKIQRQLSATAGQVTYWMMMPPSTGPSPEARPDTPPHTPIAAPRFSGANTVAMMLSVDGHHGRAADALQDAEGDQQVDRRGEAAGQRPEGEQHHAGEEELAPAPEVAEAAHGHEQDGERQDVGVHHPLDVAVRGVVVGLDVRDGDVHDRAVEQDHEEAEAEHGQHGPRVAGRAGRARRGRRHRRDGGHVSRRPFSWSMRAPRKATRVSGSMPGNRAKTASRSRRQASKISPA